MPFINVQAQVTENKIIPYKKISKTEALKYFDQIEVLIMTATKIETESLHQALGHIDGVVLKAGIDSFTYFFGYFGEHLITHVQCKAGSATSSGSAVVASHAIGLCKPKALIMVGIAFGMDNKKQKIGDILVSDMLLPYEFQRLGITGDIHRGGAPKASNYLCNRFSNHHWQNEYQLTPKGKMLSSQVFAGLMLSGEKLIDDPIAKENLREKFPEAIGGEMEGAGLAASAEVSRTDWIIVKGICDFADGNKSKNKKKFQSVASIAAVDYCQSVLSEPFILEELGVQLIASSTDKKITTADYNTVLFRGYSKSSEQFYQSRDIDFDFNDFLCSYSIWLFGSSGLGKSTVIMRNLLNSGYEVVQIYLAIGNQTDINSILLEILNKLRFHFDIVTPPIIIDNHELTINAITDLILENFDFSKHIIYLDEIPEYRINKIFEDFCHALYVINTKINNVNTHIKVLFVLSSITSPKTHLNGFQDKIRESFKFVELLPWDDEDLYKLLLVIDKALTLNFDEQQQGRIISGCKGSPRDMKRIIRDYLSTKGRPTYSLERIIKEIEQEKK